MNVKLREVAGRVVHPEPQDAISSGREPSK